MYRYISWETAPFLDNTAIITSSRLVRFRYPSLTFHQCTIRDDADWCPRYTVCDKRRIVFREIQTRCYDPDRLLIPTLSKCPFDTKTDQKENPKQQFSRNTFHSPIHRWNTSKSIFRFDLIHRGLPHNPAA